MLVVNLLVSLFPSLSFALLIVVVIPHFTSLLPTLYPPSPPRLAIGWLLPFDSISHLPLLSLALPSLSLSPHVFLVPTSFEHPPRLPCYIVFSPL